MRVLENTSCPAVPAACCEVYYKYYGILNAVLIYGRTYQSLRFKSALLIMLLSCIWHSFYFLLIKASAAMSAAWRLGIPQAEMADNSHAQNSRMSSVMDVCLTGLYAPDWRIKDKSVF